MKIAIDISQTIYGTGVSRYTRKLVSKLLEEDQQNHYVLFGGSLRRKKELDLWLNRLPQKHLTSRTNHLPPKLLSLVWNNLHLLPSKALTGPVDLIHTSDWAEPPATTAKVTTIHDLAFFKDPTYTPASVRNTQKKRLYWVTKESTRIIAVSQSTKEDCVKYLNINPDRIDVVYEAASITPPPTKALKSLAAFFTKLGIKKHYLYVPGSGNPRKNIKRIIAAWEKAELEDHQLVISGPATPEEKSLVTKGVVFTGQVDSVDLPYLFQHADGLVFPSLYEGFGLPILDAFKVGTPVLTADVSSMPEIAGKAAVLVAPTSVEDITTGIYHLLKNKKPLIKKGLKRVKDFSWKKAARQTLKVYEHALKDYQNQTKANVNRH